MSFDHETNNNLNIYKFFTENVDNYDFQKQGIKNIHSENPISSLYFSKHNIETLQNGIRYSVYTKTTPSQIIDKQSENELLIIMRSIYLQYCKHKSYNIIEQVKDLNTKVLDFAVPKILTELNQYINYKVDASSLPMPMARSKNMSQTGTKILYSREF